MKCTNADRDNSGPFDDFLRTLDGREWPATTGVAHDEAVDLDDDVHSWFSLNPNDHGSHERPDELALLSLTTIADPAPSCDAEHEESRWM